MKLILIYITFFCSILIFLNFVIFELRLWVASIVKGSEPKLYKIINVGKLFIRVNDHLPKNIPVD